MPKRLQRPACAKSCLSQQRLDLVCGSSLRGRDLPRAGMPLCRLSLCRVALRMGLFGGFVHCAATTLMVSVRSLCHTLTKAHQVGPPEVSRSCLRLRCAVSNVTITDLCKPRLFARHRMPHAQEIGSTIRKHLTHARHHIVVVGSSCSQIDPGNR